MELTGGPYLGSSAVRGTNLESSTNSEGTPFDIWKNKPSQTQRNKQPQQQQQRKKKIKYHQKKKEMKKPRWCCGRASESDNFLAMEMLNLQKGSVAAFV